LNFSWYKAVFDAGFYFFSTFSKGYDFTLWKGVHASELWVFVDTFYHFNTFPYSAPSFCLDILFISLEI